MESSCPLDEQRDGERSGDDADRAEAEQTAGADDDARENVPTTGRREPISHRYENLSRRDHRG